MNFNNLLIATSKLLISLTGGVLFSFLVFLALFLANRKYSLRYKAATRTIIATSILSTITVWHLASVTSDYLKETSSSTPTTRHKINPNTINTTHQPVTEDTPPSPQHSQPQPLKDPSISLQASSSFNKANHPQPYLAKTLKTSTTFIPTPLADPILEFVHKTNSKQVDIALLTNNPLTRRYLEMNSLKPIDIEQIQQIAESLCIIDNTATLEPDFMIRSTAIDSTRKPYSINCDMIKTYITKAIEHTYLTATTK